MSDDLVSLTTAREQAEVARTELRGAMNEALGWLSPTRLKAEAAQAASHQIDEVKTALRRSVHRHPLIAWPTLALIGAAALYLLRRPIAALALRGVDTMRMLRRFFRRNQP